jgi:hypothetical protein
VYARMWHRQSGGFLGSEHPDALSIAAQ